jgi:hypothetical protein
MKENLYTEKYKVGIDIVRFGAVIQYSLVGGCQCWEEYITPIFRVIR